MNKRKILLGFLGICVFSGLKSQVGINTETPRATLEVVAQQPDGTTNEGFLAPQLGKQRLANIQQDKLVGGTLVYVLDVDSYDEATLPDDIAKNRVAEVLEPGFYWYNKEKDKWLKTMGKDGADGTPGIGLRIKGTLGTTEDLIDIEDPQPGDGYITRENGRLHFFTQNSQWEDVGRIVGRDGLSYKIRNIVDTRSSLDSIEAKSGDGYITRDTGRLYFWDTPLQWEEINSIPTPTGQYISILGSLPTFTSLGSKTNTRENQAYIIEDEGSIYYRTQGRWERMSRIVDQDYNPIRLIGNLPPGEQFPENPRVGDAYIKGGSGQAKLFVFRGVTGWKDSGQIIPDQTHFEQGQDIRFVKKQKEGIHTTYTVDVKKHIYKQGNGIKITEIQSPTKEKEAAPAEQQEALEDKKSQKTDAFQKEYLVEMRVQTRTINAATDELKLKASDNGNYVLVKGDSKDNGNGGAIQLDFDDDVTEDFNCIVIQMGTSAVTVKQGIAVSTAPAEYSESMGMQIPPQTRAQYSAMGVIRTKDKAVLITGDTVYAAVKAKSK